jgi:hypothetical protein
MNILEPIGLTPLDPRWVSVFDSIILKMNFLRFFIFINYFQIGAWWLGFLIIAAVLIGPSIALFCFPKNATGESDEDTEDSTDATGKTRTPGIQKCLYELHQLNETN